MRITWDEYFLQIAKAVSRRSTCIRRQYGAVIVQDYTIVATGYNGSARGETNCIDTGSCEREELGIPPGQNYELCNSVHAEANAIINCDPVKMGGATMYIAGCNKDGSPANAEPCLMCARMLKNAKIKRIVKGER